MGKMVDGVEAVILDSAGPLPARWTAGSTVPASRLVLHVRSVPQPPRCLRQPVSTANTTTRATWRVRDADGYFWFVAAPTM